ncbi:hypothetical protein GCM10007275_04310 [Jeotgalicoccus coquinae]|uniref:ABC-type thiamine/hydroxymethylpyrimidine transport system permease subunit n=1 Tax=Jeotgalicoccus coquinae TaxID=709509 RepID=A0A6V7R889_9STAP|nr:DUF2627 domain-containing protein [Jeotgalicoccus coquinae]MBB6422902.1 ABC-type thiamine/hydroxymethylpyrimidine transport system permease subunit [Jeotgalicoccus coquinae]GGE12237.1 hypothetical protein GCM10007275_04310 [Jeotgalicoccus coquinae]CAD2073697.1 hypothetical protein JEOCOQ751_00778 [Jeotgalicoccus coquinae]
MLKIIALIILVIPGIIAGVGIKLMRDSIFGIVIDPFTYTALQFFAGLIMTALGIWFIGGYLLYRERKNKRAQERFMKQTKKSGED